MKTLEELLSGKTVLQVKSELLDFLSAQGFGLTNFLAGSPERTLIEAEAYTLADVYKLAVAITKGGFIDYATGDWLDLCATFYGLTRKPAVFTEFDLVLSCSASQGPYTIAVGQLWASTGSGKIYNNTAGGLLASGGSLTLRFKADESGSSFNASDGAINRLITALPGVTINNPTGSLKVTGANTETDEAFRRRCKLRWAELGGGATKRAYEFWALTASPAVTQALVLDQTENAGLGGGNGAQGTVDVILWGDGLPIVTELADVQAFIADRKPVTANVSVYSAVAQPVAITATITVRSAFRAAAEATVASNLEALRRSVPIGGVLYRSEIIEQLMAPAGVINAVVASPTGDTTLNRNAALTLTLTLTWVEV